MTTRRPAKPPGTATSTIFNVRGDKYGPLNNFRPAEGRDSKISGWSPTGNLPPGASLKEIEEEKRVEEYQRSHLNSFTVRELVDLDVVSSRVLEEGNLTFPIHPIFSKKKWEKDGQRPLRWTLTSPDWMDSGHQYTIEAPAVFEAMMPVLTLASAFLSRMHFLPFMDALLLGPRKPMDQACSTIPLPPNITTFWRRDPGVHSAKKFAEIEKTFSFTLSQLYKNIRWGFAQGPQMPWDKEYMLESRSLGVTSTEPDANGQNTVWIFLDSYLCNLLMRNDLTSAEKAGAQYLLATVMCHELMHAIWSEISDRKVNHPRYEPFFEDAPQCELGYEMENRTFGGLVESLFDAPAAPFAYAMNTTYPTYAHMDARIPDTIIMNKARPYNDINLSYFIPIQTFEDIRKQSFWDIGIRQFGLSVIHARAIKHGWKSDFAADWNNTDEEGMPTFEPGYLKRISEIGGVHFEEYSKMLKSLGKVIGKTLSPDKKASFKMMEAIVDSAMKEEAFYDFSLAQEHKLEDIRESFVSLREAQSINDQAEANRIAQNLIQLLKKAVVNHKTTFEHLARSETLRGGEKFHDRRATLFRWNKGTRRLLNDLYTLAHDIPDNIPKMVEIRNDLTALLCNLEFVRLQIFPPTSSWTPGHQNTPEGIEELERWPRDFFNEEIDELDFMANLHIAADNHDSTECHTLTQGRLRDNSGASAMSFYCRFICDSISTVNTHEYLSQHWEERKVVIDRIILMLQEIQKGCIEAWSTVFALWNEWFVKFGRRTEEEQKLHDEEEERERERIEKERGKRKWKY